MNKSITIPILKSSTKRFHAMSKPVGSLCNLDCKYCYYLSKEDLLHQPVKPAMDDALLEKFIKQYIENNSGPEVVFTWQGGEPTLLGVDYFRKIVEIQKKYKDPQKVILNDLQTNGTHLDDSWCEFLKAHNFLVGISIDGPENLHDIYRVNKGGEPTFRKVFNSIELLKRYEIPFSTLTCINDQNSKHGKEIYKFLVQDIGSTKIQFIPIVEPINFRTTSPDLYENFYKKTNVKEENKDCKIVEDWSVQPLEWGKFLVDVFDEWYQFDVGRVLVNWFESMVSVRLGLGSQMCVTNDFCGKNVAIEFNGDVYSCDHFVYPEFKLGNINEKELGQLVFDSKQIKFGVSKKEALPKYCLDCSYLNDCWGECPKNRLLMTPDGELGLNYLCQGYKYFYGHVTPKINYLVKEISTINEI